MSSIFKRIASGLVAGALLTLPLTASAWTRSITCEGGTLGAKVTQGVAGTFSSSFSTVYANSPVLNGSQSCKMSITQGSDGWAKFGGIYVFDSKLVKGDEVWVRVNLYIPQGFIVSTNTGMLKFMRIHTASSSGDNQGYHDLLLMQPGATIWQTGVGDRAASYIYNYEGLPGLNGIGNGTTGNFTPGKWESYEMYVKLDSVSKSAGGSGQVRIWKNNVLVLNKTDKATLVNSTSYSDSFYLFSYWNGNAPATQSLYVDDVVITSDIPSRRDAEGNPFIGGEIAISDKAPSAPTSVSVQ